MLFCAARDLADLINHAKFCILVSQHCLVNISSALNLAQGAEQLRLAQTNLLPFHRLSPAPLGTSTDRNTDHLSFAFLECCLSLQRRRLLHFPMSVPSPASTCIALEEKRASASSTGASDRSTGTCLPPYRPALYQWACARGSPRMYNVRLESGSLAPPPETPARGGKESGRSRSQGARTRFPSSPALFSPGFPLSKLSRRSQNTNSNLELRKS